MLMSESKYDRVPFISKPSPERHPERFRTIAKLFGMNTPPTAEARILELGCSTGENLIPLAEVYPTATFLGIDISEAEIKRGTQVLQELGLQNIELRSADLTKLDASLGTFDYIICHGLYSWASDLVRDGILAVCHDHLTENGVAFVSYNCHPGWSTRQSLREAIAYREDSSFGDEERISRARALLKVFLGLLEEEYHPSSILLKNEVQNILSQSDGYLLHELLADEVRPFRFEEFVAHAGKHDLQYLGDGRFSRMRFHRFLEAECEDAIREEFLTLTENDVEREQYIDFLFPVSLRGTLLCHSSHAIERALDPELLSDYYLGSSLRPASAAVRLDVSSTDEFFDSRGATLELQDPIEKAAFLVFSEVWPSWISYADLRKRVEGILAARAAAKAFLSNDDEVKLRAMLLQLALRGFVELHIEPPRFSVTPPETPEISAFARGQADNVGWATNRRHEYVVLGDIERSLFALLDGKHSRSDLASFLVNQLATGALSVREEGEPVTDKKKQARYAEDMVVATLDLIARGAFFDSGS